MAIVIGVSPSLADSSYTFTITNSSKETLAQGTFRGKDANRDGWIDSNELTNFSIQQTTHLHGYPEFSISHTKEDLDPGSFKFAEANWKKRKDGRALLEFKVYGGKGIVMGFGFFLEQGEEKPENEKATWHVVSPAGGELYNASMTFQKDLAVWVKRGR